MKSHLVFSIFKTALKTTGIMAASNVVFDAAAALKNFTCGRKGEIYAWKYGNIFYTVKGTGSPILLLHDLTPSSSGEEMSVIGNYLAASHTVYTIDLLGFGLSEKPWITYTNFFYIMLIRDFIRNIIKDKTVIYARKGSCLIALQANSFLKDDVGGVFMIDPAYSEKISFPKNSAFNLRKLIEIPLYGTFVYNIYSLICGFPANKSSKHIFLSLLCGHVTTDISKHHNLIGANVKVIESTPIRKKLLDELYYSDSFISSESIEKLNPVR